MPSQRTDRQPILPCLLIASALLVPASSASAQVGGPAAPANPYVVKMFHGTPPLPSYDVATIKKPAPAQSNGPIMMPLLGTGDPRGTTLKNYILSAYGVSTLSQAQVVGGPAWLTTDLYVITGKPSDELRDAMQKMKPAERLDQNRMMQQSLLAERFNLKAHFETRQLPLFQLTAAKGGLKIKPVPPPPAFVPGQAPPPPPPPPAPGSAFSLESMRPGMVVMTRKPGSMTAISGRAATMNTIVNLVRTSQEVGGKPVLDLTGFTSNFDIDNLEWADFTAVPTPGSDTDAPSLFTALEEKLGLKLTETKGPVEVLVIDSIDRPSEN